MRDYYLEILELPTDASERDIKAAYRKLSKKYHPDRNTQKNADEKFIEVTQAYEYLTKPQPYPYSKAVEPEVSEYERWRQQARERAQQQKREEAAAREALIRRLLFYFNYVAVGILIFNVLLAIDFILPRQAHQQNSLQVKKVFESSRYGQSYQYDDLHFEGFTMRINKGEIRDEEFFEEATVMATVIFRKPQIALLTANGQTTRFKPAYSIYQIFGFLIPLMFILLAIYRYGMKLPDNLLGLAIFMLLMLLIQILTFMIS